MNGNTGFISLLDRDEQNHGDARRRWGNLVEHGSPLYCTSYVLLETVALIQSRLGMDPLRAFHENIAPFLRVLWVDEVLHETGMTTLLAANRRQLNLVDCASFSTIRQVGINSVFAFHNHFTAQGFTVIH